MNHSIIIVGAGISGLSAGYYAQLNGYHSQIYEMNSIPGGLRLSWSLYVSSPDLMGFIWLDIGQFHLQEQFWPPCQVDRSYNSCAKKKRNVLFPH